MMNKIVLAIILGLSFSQFATADQYLIDEMESLRAELDKNDPDRVELGLRLADLYFDVSIQEGEGSKIIQNRKNALKLYEDALYGKDGLPKAEPKRAIVIKYQLARVLGKLGEYDRSAKFYLDVFTSNLSSNKLKRESAFSLAEHWEEKVHFHNADKYYLEALKLCETHESKNYGHYKRAWLHYKEVKIETAISELKLALWEKDGTVRDKVINDLLLFFSSQMTNGEKELAYIRELRTKTNRPELVKRLVEAFYAAGNRIAGATVLVELNKESPDAFYEMRLLEEFYGFRDIDLVKRYLSALEKRNIKDLPKAKDEAKEFKAMLKRVIVQFDSEAESNPAYSKVLQRAVDQYLGFYHNDDMRLKMQQGWLKVEKNNLAKIERLKKWINEDTKLKKDLEQVRKFRQTRLALAQKEKKADIIIEEALAIAEYLTKTDKEMAAREFHYVAAHELYKRKDYDRSLKMFMQLADLSHTESIDKWAVQSQNLALDILNEKKLYTEITIQADAWLNYELVNTQANLKKDIAEMKLVRKQANYQAIAGLGESFKALEQFYRFCFEKVYEKKSCQNAKILAVKLKDQEKLVKLLEKAKDEKTLVVEYELMGRFSDSAKLQEKFDLTSKAPIETYLKIALLFEIDEDFKNRDRILNKLVSKIKREKTLELKYEGIIYTTLERANLLTDRSLLLPWSLDRKIGLAQRLAVEKPSKANKKLLTNSENYTGSVWAKNVLAKAQRLYKKQAKMSFYGRASKARFQRKVRVIEKLRDYGNKYLAGANSEVRVYLLDMLTKTYQIFGADILNTPIPEGLTEDILMQVQANLTQMAAPYLTVGDDYLKLKEKEMAALDVEAKSKVTHNLAMETIDYPKLIASESFDIVLTRDLDFSTLREQKRKLLTNPLDVSVLESIQKDFSKKDKRIAAYFTGRINSLRDSND